ncbi:MAG: hypothetical protein AAF050_18315 [Cyanobacteria bacterium J06649_5]
MPIYLPPLVSRWMRPIRRWQRSLSLALISAIAAPMLTVSTVSAQSVETTSLDIVNSASATYMATGSPVSLTSNQIVTGVASALIDPAGNLVGCNGQPLSSYSGFSMALYEPDASGLDIEPGVVQLTSTTEANSIEPNVDNNNPFFLLPDSGRYNFLLDPNAPLSGPLNTGLTQTSEGARYILVINPPEGSDFSERRVQIVVNATVVNATDNTQVLSYTATSLDGQPLSIDGATELTQTVEVRNAESQSLTFFEFGVDATICEASQVSVTKSADRSAAQPGDTVAYRLTIQNLAKVELDSIVAIDTLPAGFEFVPDSLMASTDGEPIPVSATLSGNTVSFRVTPTISEDQVLDIVYATRLTPDALRGSGRNSVIVTAQRTDTGYRVQDGPSTHRITLDPGILSDCGTLLGRVFEDKNFDGEQQNGEAGIPNAVIFLDDGNRVVTDADGLFSVQKMLPGQRTGTLDLSSLPGYTLAPNLYFNERNSQSRLVNLAPGGLVRMNFGVTPTFQEEQE